MNTFCNPCSLEIIIRFGYDKDLFHNHDKYEASNVQPNKIEQIQWTIILSFVFPDWNYNW